MIFSRRTKPHPPVLAACMILALLWLFNDKRVANQELLKHDHSFTNMEVSSIASSKPEFMDAKPQIEDKVVVIGKLSNEDTSWVVELQKWISSISLLFSLQLTQLYLNSWTSAIYTVDSLTAPLHTPMNKGKEGVAYLTYIIDNYHALPRTMAFIHAHRDGYPRAWHVDCPNYSNVGSLLALRTDFIQPQGYANLRCIHEPGCRNPAKPFQSPEDVEPDHIYELSLPEAWGNIFEGVEEMAEIPEEFATACCAQFAVSREQVLKNDLQQYVRLRDWLIETTLSDDMSGRVLEYLWHVIFGRPAVECPQLEKCWCDLYGRCELWNMQGLAERLETWQTTAFLWYVYYSKIFSEKWDHCLKEWEMNQAKLEVCLELILWICRYHPSALDWLINCWFNSCLIGVESKGS